MKKTQHYTVICKLAVVIFVAFNNISLFSKELTPPTIRLFSKDGKSVLSSFRRSMHQLLGGDFPFYLTLNGDERLLLSGLYGKGGRNAIFKTSDDRALRIPLTPEAFSWGEIRNYHLFQQQLSSMGVPVPRVLENIDDHALLMEAIDIDSTLDLIFDQNLISESITNLTNEQMRKMIEGLVSLARASHGVCFINDMSFDQMAFTKDNKLILLDFDWVTPWKADPQKLKNSLDYVDNYTIFSFMSDYNSEFMVALRKLLGLVTYGMRQQSPVTEATIDGKIVELFKMVQFKE